MTEEEKKKEFIKDYNEKLPVFFEAIQWIAYNDTAEKRIRFNDLTLLASNGSVLICEGQGVMKAICRVDNREIYWFSHAASTETGVRTAFLLEVVMNIHMLDKKYLV